MRPENWNQVVGQDDIVYVLGDVFFCQDRRAAQILERLPGRKKLILGNHDKLLRKSKPLQGFFEEMLPPLHEEVIDKVPVVMCPLPAGIVEPRVSRCIYASWACSQPAAAGNQRLSFRCGSGCKWLPPGGVEPAAGGPGSGRSASRPAAGVQGLERDVGQA